MQLGSENIKSKGWGVTGKKEPKGGGEEVPGKEHFHAAIFSLIIQVLLLFKI
jgi:hypothetical protein